MNNAELNEYVERIFSYVFAISTEDKSDEEIKDYLKNLVMEIETEGRRLGRTQILNYFETEIKNIR